MTTFFDNQVVVIRSPVGKLQLVFSENQLLKIIFADSDMPIILPKTRAAHQVVNQLAAYFKNPHFQFDVSIKRSGTSFQRKVYNALQKIPPGETYAYGELAAILKTSPRAVGNACRWNAIPIIIPCHRVVGQKDIGGYSGKTDGKQIRIKKWLLEHEAR